MNKDTKKFVISGSVGLLSFLFFAFGFIFVKMRYASSWWSGVSTNGYELIGKLKNFGGFLTSLFSIIILICSGLVVFLSIFGITNSLGKTKFKLGKLTLDKLIKWILFITICLAFLNIFWILINTGTLNTKFGDKNFKYVIAFTPFLIFIIQGLTYCFYCLLDGNFLWMPNWWNRIKKSKNKNLDGIKQNSNDMSNNAENEILNKEEKN